MLRDLRISARKSRSRLGEILAKHSRWTSWEEREAQLSLAPCISVYSCTQVTTLAAAFSWYDIWRPHVRTR